MFIFQRILLLSFILLLIGIDVSAQSKKALRKEKRAERRANTIKHRSPVMIYPVYWGIQDTRTSPGIYRVFGAGASFRLRTIRPKYVVEHLGQANIGLGSPNFENGALQYNFQFLFESYYLWPLTDNIKVGGAASGFQHSRIAPALSNSSFASDAAFSVGPVGKWETKMNLFKKETDLGITIAFPVASVVNRIPIYGLSFTGANTFFAPIGRFNRITLRVDANRFYKKSVVNKINYFYRWDYYGLEEFEGLHHLRIASHQVGFNLWIKKN